MTSKFIRVDRVLWRHKKKAVAVFLTTLALAVVVTLLSPKAYRSEGKLLVRLGRENATLDATATLGLDPVVAVPTSRETELNSIVEVIRSRAVAEKVVDALGPEVVLGLARDAGEGNRGALAAMRSWGRQLDGSRELDRREQAVLKIVQKVFAAPARRSNVIDIACEGPSPEWSQMVTAQLMEVYLAEHVRLSRTHGSSEFFAAQVETASHEMAEAERKLCDLKASTGLVAVGDQSKALVERISRLENELGEAERERAVAESRVRHLRNELPRLPQKEVTSQTQGFTNDGTDRMRDQLYALELRREEAASRLTPEHPMMRQIEEQVAAARAIVQRQEGTRTQVTTTRSRLLEEAEHSVFQDGYALATWQTKVDTLKNQLADCRKELKLFNAHQTQIARAEQELEIKQASYRTFATNLEKVKVDQAMGAQNISNISVAQAATLEPKAVRPNRAMLLALGMFMSLLAAAGIAIVGELADQRLRRPEDVERELDLPLLGSFPMLGSEELVLVVKGNGHAA